MTPEFESLESRDTPAPLLTAVGAIASVIPVTPPSPVITPLPPSDQDVNAVVNGLPIELLPYFVPK